MPRDADKPKVCKRVVLRVWQQDGEVRDNAHQIDWLERNGWRVVSSEPLTGGYAGSSAYVLYQLARDRDAAGPDPGPPFPPPLIDPCVPCPADTTGVVLSCSAAGARVVVRELNGRGEPAERVIVPGPGDGPAAGFAAIDFAGPGAARSVAVFCVHQAPPAVPAPDCGPDYPDAPPAVVRVDAYFGGSAATDPGRLRAALVENVTIPPGGARAFYFTFRRGG